MLLKNGSTGNYVMYLQYGLHIMCCPPGSFDSKFGSGTENAVKKYQGKKGLTQDGIVGDGTWNALVSDIKTIQQLLKNKGYYASTVDGLAGSGTYNAVISFQKASGLTADGMVGSATLNALNASSGGTSGQSHSITLPTDRNYLWAQKNPDIVKLVGNSGCSLVAVLNTANIYGPREFTPNEVLTACGNWGANGLNALWQETMALTAPVFEISPFRTRPLATLSSTTSAKRTATGTPTSSPSALHGTSTSKSQPPATPTCSPNWKPLARFQRAA